MSVTSLTHSLPLEQSRNLTPGFARKDRARAEFFSETPFSAVVGRIIESLDAQKAKGAFPVQQDDAIRFALEQLAKLNENKIPEIWEQDCFRTSKPENLGHFVTDRKANISSADRIRITESSDGKRLELILYNTRTNGQKRIVECCDGTRVDYMVCGVRIWSKNGFAFHNGDQWVAS